MTTRSLASSSPSHHSTSARRWCAKRRACREGTRARQLACSECGLCMNSIRLGPVNESQRWWSWPTHAPPENSGTPQLSSSSRDGTSIRPALAIRPISRHTHTGSRMSSSV